MIKLELKFKIENQKLTFLDKEFIVDKSNNYLKLFFEFATQDWNDLHKFAILKNSKRKAYQFRITDKEAIIVPSEVLIGKYFLISIYGADINTNRITTNEIRINLKQSGYTANISQIHDTGRDIFIEMEELIDNLPAVAVSGSYNDLLDIPLEFPPEPHTHESQDITDISDTIGADTRVMLYNLKDIILR